MTKQSRLPSEPKQEERSNEQKIANRESKTIRHKYLQSRTQKCSDESVASEDSEGRLQKETEKAQQSKKEECNTKRRQRREQRRQRRKQRNKIRKDESADVQLKAASKFEGEECCLEEKTTELGKKARESYLRLKTYDEIAQRRRASDPKKEEECRVLSSQLLARKMRRRCSSEPTTSEWSDLQSTASRPCLQHKPRTGRNKEENSGLQPKPVTITISRKSRKDGNRISRRSASLSQAKNKPENDKGEFPRSKSERGGQKEELNIPEAPTGNIKEEKGSELHGGDFVKEIEILARLADKIKARKNLAYEGYQKAQRHYENFAREEQTINSQIQSLIERANPSA